MNRGTQWKIGAMDSAGRGLVIALVLLASWTTLPRSGFAQSEETGGIGGTGINTPTGEETGGIGGTGVGRRGVPIVGYGPIQRFGSVFVNGREYALTGDTLVTINDVPATVAALRIGDIAQVQGVVTGLHRGVALSISVRDAIVGTVTEVSGRGSAFSVLGQRVVSATEGKPFAGIHVGERVAVSAQRQADGNWAAQRVAILPASNDFRLEARITSISAGRIRVAGTAIDAPHQLTAGLQLGQRVAVTGTKVADGLRASTIAPRPIALGAPGTSIEVQNYFRSVGNGRIEASDGMVATGAPQNDQLTGAASVEIDGRLITPDSIAIERIDIDTPVAPDLSEAATRHSQSTSAIEGQESNGFEVAEPQAGPETEVEPPDDVASPVEVEPPDIGEPNSPVPDIEPPEHEPPEISIPTPHVEPPEVDVQPDR